MIQSNIDQIRRSVSTVYIDPGIRSYRRITKSRWFLFYLERSPAVVFVRRNNLRTIVIAAGLFFVERLLKRV